MAILCFSHRQLKRLKFIVEVKHKIGLKEKSEYLKGKKNVLHTAGVRVVELAQECCVV